MATEKEAASPAPQEPMEPDHGEERVLSPPAVAVDPGGATPSPPTPQNPTSPITQPQGQIITETSTDPLLHKTNSPPPTEEITTSQVLTDNIIPTTTQALLASIIQSNPNYTYALSQPSLDANTELNTRPTTVISSPQITNTPSVIVLANSAQYTNTLSDDVQGEQYIIEYPAQFSNDSGHLAPDTVAAEEEVVLTGQQAYIPEEDSMPIASSNSSPHTVDYPQVCLQNTVTSSTVVISNSVPTTEIALNGGQVLFDGQAVQTLQVNPEPVQVSINPSFSVPASASTNAATLGRHSIITTYTQAIQAPLLSVTGGNNIASVIANHPVLAQDHEQQSPPQHILQAQQHSQLHDQVQQQLQQEEAQRQLQDNLQQENQMRDHLQQPQVPQQIQEETTVHLQQQTQQQLREHLLQKQQTQQLKEQLQQQAEQQQQHLQLQQAQHHQQPEENLLQHTQQEHLQQEQQLEQQQTQQQLQEQLLQQQRAQHIKELLQQQQAEQQQNDALQQQQLREQQHQLREQQQASNLQQQQLREQQQQASNLQQQQLREQQQQLREQQQIREQQQQLPNLQQQQQQQLPTCQAPTPVSQPALVSLSNFVLANAIPRREVIMRSASGTPPLSSSDVLMSSYNVLEDGDPVHRYQSNTVSTNPPHKEYEAQPSGQVFSQWPDTALDHNRSAILKALQEKPVNNREVSRQSEGTVVEHLQPPTTTTTVSRNLQWKNYKQQNEEPKYTQMEVAKPHTVTYTSRPTVLPPVSPSYPNTATDGPTTALKSAFAGAHFLCKFCPERFRIPEKLTEHIKRVHSGSVVYTCFTCGKKFYNSHDLREHVPIHANEPIKCSLCNLTLDSTKELRAHHKKAHPLSTMSCPLCDKVFGSSSARAKHIRAEHRNDKTLIMCEECNDPFVDRAAYDEHIRTHRKTMHAIQSGQLTVTSQRQTSPTSTVVIWKCDKCGIVFPNDIELNKHASTVHAAQIVAPKMMTTVTEASCAPAKFPPGTTSVPATKYELLRLLLKRRKAAESGTIAMTPENQVDYGIQTVNAVTGQPDGSSRPPDELLTAEAMQHVAEELSRLQGMHQQKNIVQTPLTADNIIDADSTMGINLTVSKNASPATKVKEMQKHKTLVNMLQGTVASIIEREVKQPRTVRNMSWTEQGVKHPGHMTNGQHIPSPTIPVTKPSPMAAYTHYTQENSVPQNTTLLAGVVQTNTSGSTNTLGIENQQMLAQNSIANQYTTTTQENYTSNLLPAQSSIQEVAFQNELRSFLDMSQNINTPTDVIQVTSASAVSNQNPTSKATTSWDCPIEPLIKLFQNVNPPVTKIPVDEHLTNPGGKAPELQCTIQDQAAPNVREDNAILDLSSNRSNYYGIGSHPSQIPPDIASGRLPHFNEVSWATGREKNTDSGLYEKTTQSETGFYETYSTYTNPHSDLNQMSGGHLTYVQSGQSQEAVTSFYEHNIEGAQYVPAREQNLNSYVQYAETDQDKPASDDPIHMQGNGELQVLQDQHLSILNQQHLQQHPNHPDEQLLLQQQLQQHQPDAQQSQYLENTNDSFSQMLHDNTMLHIQNEPQIDSLHNPNQQYLKIVDGQNGNILHTDNVPPMISPEQHYLEPNNNNSNGNKQDSEYQKLYEKFCKNTKPQYEGLRNMILSRRFNPDVPLVVRHKLLATMLKEGSAEGQTSPSKEPDSTTDGHSNGLITGNSNIQHIDSNHQMTSAYQVNIQNTLNQGHFTRPEELMAVKAVKHGTDQTTVDHQLLSQMMSEMPPSPDIHSLQCMPGMRKQDLVPPPLIPHSKLTNQLGGYDLGLPVPVGNMNNTRLGEIHTSPDSSMMSPISDIQRRLSYEKGLGVRLHSQKRKPTKPCPAIHKRKCTVTVQKAEDLFIVRDRAVSVQTEKRKHSCEELRCRVPKIAKPSPAKSRGRPPKNGHVPMKKGSYKKGQYPCPVCKKVYAWKNYLRIHIAKHDKDIKKKEESPNVQMPDDDMPPLLPPITNVL